MSDEPGAWPGSDAASGEDDESVIGRVVRAAAREATEDVLRHMLDVIDPATLGQLHADVARLSRLTRPGEQIAAFADMRQIRDRIYALLDRKLWPGQRAELYLLLGLLHEMMAAIAYWAGVPAAAVKLIRTSLAYADAIGDEPLKTRLRASLPAIVN
jgi:hypothetical protein